MNEFELEIFEQSSGYSELRLPSTAASSRFLSCCDVRVQGSGEMAAAASGSCVCDDK